MDAVLPVLEQKVNALIETDPDVFLVEIRIKPTNNVKVFLDADQGINVDRLIQYNRKLYKDLEESGLFPDGDFSLELSSPGLDEPLKLPRQYRKNLGRFVEVVLVDGTREEGKLLDSNDQRLLLEQEKGKGKKKEVLQKEILMEQVRSTKIQVKF
ncbi:MAG: ribosome maturation factor RimP [Chitinophagaceae bacterium]|jgi:ribosome maturation factor RimP